MAETARDRMICKHTDRILGICIECGDDNGAISRLRVDREQALRRFADIRKSIEGGPA